MTLSTTELKKSLILSIKFFPENLYLLKNVTALRAFHKDQNNFLKEFHIREDALYRANPQNTNDQNDGDHHEIHSVTNPYSPVVQSA